MDQARRENAKRYDQLLEGIPGITSSRKPPTPESVYHLYVILADDRDGLQKYLREKGVGTGLHYPLPLHLQKAYAPRASRRATSRSPSAPPSACSRCRCSRSLPRSKSNMWRAV